MVLKDRVEFVLLVGCFGSSSFVRCCVFLSLKAGLQASVYLLVAGHQNRVPPSDPKLERTRVSKISSYNLLLSVLSVFKYMSFVRINSP